MNNLFLYRRVIITAVALFLLLYLSSCKTEKSIIQDEATAKEVTLDQVAANEEVTHYLESFEGRGDLADSSQPTLATEALNGFRYPDDLALELVLAEPMIHQPVEISFDHRGRLWVVQYNQYPYPEGLKVTSIDYHLRVKFDKVPEPPPEGVKGVDKITFFEDTNGDGRYDKATDAITGLNIATSVILGRGNIWVLSPPYLLAYPDPDGDGLPNSSPVVHLEGFGLEDTHAVANSLRWGPDGWLYGAQGSTTTANISSSVSKNVSFQGQAIWRYHPESHIFEVFAEGGGNTFDVEIDAKGRIYSGDNGIDRGMYYKQGGYYTKNWGKHGPLTNPYAFGYLPNMILNGDKKRFTHAWIKYEGGSLSAKYQDKMIAINPLQSYVQLTRFEKKGSNFSNVDEERILETDDHWFRPVDVRLGPDGAVYLADWYDSRLSHIDPRDTWHKSSGRIYRLRNRQNKEPIPTFNLANYSNHQLIDLLSHPNKWFRQQALQQFGDRKDLSVIPTLQQLLESETGQIALEALWAINLSGGFNDAIATTALNHRDPFVRMWGVRLLGDSPELSPVISSQLAQLAAQESHPEVRSQLAATAKRLSGTDAISIIQNLLKHHDDARDPDIPLQIWWALEAKAESDREVILNLFEDTALWYQPTVQETLLARLMQRYIMAGGDQNLATAAHLFELAPTAESAKILMTGLQEGLRGREVATLPADLINAIGPYQAALAEGALTLGLRQGQPEVVKKVLKIIENEQTAVGERLAYIRVLGEVNQPQSVPVLLRVMENNQTSGAIKQATLQALSRYDEAEIGFRVVKAYPNQLRADPDVRLASLALLASRPSWAHQLLAAIDGEKKISTQSVARTIHQEDVPESIAQQLQLLNDPAIQQTVSRLWPEIQPVASSEKSERIAEVSTLLKSGTGDPVAGHSIYQSRCGTCHRLFDEGGNIGPDLTGYDRRNLNDLLLNIIDPNAEVREGYVNYYITTTDGRALTGTIAARSDQAVTLQPLGREAITLAADQISEMRAQPISLMPERLLSGLTDQQVRDLFSYLMKE